VIRKTGMFIMRVK